MTQRTIHECCIGASGGSLIIAGLILGGQIMLAGPEGVNFVPNYTLLARRVRKPDDIREALPQLRIDMLLTVGGKHRYPMKRFQLLQ